MNLEDMLKIQNSHTGIIEKKQKHLRNVDNLSAEEIRTIKRNTRLNEIKDKLNIMGASDYIACSNNISMMSFFYKIKSDTINFIVFDVNYYDNDDEYMSPTTYKIHKNNIISITENLDNKSVDVKTYDKIGATFSLRCSLESLRSELTLVLNYFFMSKTKKKIGLIKL